MSYNHLKHYGILGMKWGVRRKRGPDGLVIPGTTSKKAQDKAIKKERRQDSKDRRLLSDEELLAKIGRLEKERKLRELTDREIDEGKSVASDIIKDAGTRAVKTMLAGAVVYTVKAALTGKVDLKEAAKYVAPLKK